MGTMKELVTFSIEQELKEQLREIAKRKGLSLSKLMYNIALDYLVQETNSEDNKI